MAKGATGPYGTSTELAFSVKRLRPYLFGVALCRKCYTSSMPTTRPRHMITETDRIASSLEKAASLWPEIAGNRSALLRKVLEVGMESLDTSSSKRSATRLDAISNAAGSLTRVWPDNWRDEARSEWPQ